MGPPWAITSVIVAVTASVQSFNLQRIAPSQSRCVTSFAWGNPRKPKESDTSCNFVPPLQAKIDPLMQRRIALLHQQK